MINFLSIMGLIMYFFIAVFTFVNLGSKGVGVIRSFIIALLWPLNMIFMFIFMVGVLINIKRGR